MKQWAGRNSRGVTQFDGKALQSAVESFDNTIDIEDSKEFISACLKDD